MRRTSRGFTLVLALMICVLVMVLGMGVLGKRVSQYQGATAASLAAGARALAEAGLEDARVKLDKDLFFPPPGDRDQILFSYSEDVRNVRTNAVVGYYHVTVDQSWRHGLDPPDPKHPSIMRVISTGSLGPEAEKPRALVTLRMEMDFDDGRPGPPVTNPAIPSKVTDWVEVIGPGL